MMSLLRGVGLFVLAWLIWSAAIFIIRVSPLSDEIATGTKWVIAATFWIAICLPIGFVAQAKRRSGVAWFLISLVLSPVLGAILLRTETRHDVLIGAIERDY